MKFFGLFLALAAVGNGLDLNKIQNDAQGMAEKLAKDVNVGASDLGGLMKEAEDQVNKLTKDLPKGPMEKPMEKPKMVKGKPSKFTKPSPQDFQKMMKEKFEAKRKEMAKTNTDMIQKFQKLAKEKGLAKSKFLKLVYLVVYLLHYHFQPRRPWPSSRSSTFPNFKS